MISDGYDRALPNTSHQNYQIRQLVCLLKASFESPPPPRPPPPHPLSFDSCPLLHPLYLITALSSHNLNLLNPTPTPTPSISSSHFHPLPRPFARPYHPGSSLPLGCLFLTRLSVAPVESASLWSAPVCLPCVSCLPSAPYLTTSLSGHTLRRTDQTFQQLKIGK